MLIKNNIFCIKLIVHRQCSGYHGINFNGYGKSENQRNQPNQNLKKMISHEFKNSRMNSKS